MIKIKSERAEKYIMSPESLDTGVMGMVTAVVLAEQDAEERHEKEMQEVRDKCSSDIKEFTAKWEASDRKMDALHLSEMQGVKDKAVQSFCETHCFASDGTGSCDHPNRYCEHLQDFTNKLNK